LLQLQERHDFHSPSLLVEIFPDLRFYWWNRKAGKT
jgi:hypothetical protein